MRITTRERVLKEKHKEEIEELRKKENEKQKEVKTDVTPEKSEDPMAPIIHKKSELLFGRKAIFNHFKYIIFLFPFTFYFKMICINYKIRKTTRIKCYSVKSNKWRRLSFKDYRCS